MIHRFRIFLLAATLFIGCLSSRPAQAKWVECNTARILNGDGSTRDSWQECQEFEGAPPSVSGPGASYWEQSPLGAFIRTQPPAPRDVPQGGGGGAVKGTEPIELHGEFTIQDVDLVYPGKGSNFQFIRSYSSFSRYFGVLGYGWSHNYERSLIEVGGSLEYIDTEGSIRFHHALFSNTVFEPDENGNGYRLEHAGDEWILKDGSGLSYIFRDSWKPCENCTPRPLPWKPLMAIRDSLGHEQKIIWTPYDEKTWPEAKVASVRDTTGRVIYFNYENLSYSDLVSKKTVLKCLSSVQDNCNRPLVSFEYNNLEELQSVKDAMGRGDTYTYDHGYAPEKALATVDAETKCKNLCGFAAEDGRNQDFCKNPISGVSNEPSICYRSCIDVYPFLPCACAQLCHASQFVNPRQCTYHQDDLNRVLGGDANAQKGIIDARMAEFFKKNPYCKGSGSPETCIDIALEPKEPNVPRSFRYCASVSTPQECYDKCMDQNQTKDDAGNPRFSYGLKQDLNHNLVAVHDGEGRRVIKNQYGTDPSRISFDRVTDQWMGEKDSDETHVKLSYYDLTGEGAYSWNELKKQPSGWTDLLCGTAYAAEASSLAAPLTAAAAAPDPSDPLCQVLCSPDEDWRNVHVCYDLQCRVDPACMNSCHDRDRNLTDEQCYDACYDREFYGNADKKTVDPCMVDFFKKYPLCEASEREWAQYSEPFKTPQECSDRCKELYATKDRRGTPFSPYGVRRDSNNNVIAVYDEEGRRIDEPTPANIEALLANRAGVPGVPTETSWGPFKGNAAPIVKRDTVPVKKQQTMTARAEALPSKAWASVVKTIHSSGKAPSYPAFPAQGGMIVQGANDFKSVTICPQLGDSQDNPPFEYIGKPQNPPPCEPGGIVPCPPQSSLFDWILGNAWGGNAWAASAMKDFSLPQAVTPSLEAVGPQVLALARSQVPVLATVLEDLHGGKRTYYLDKKMRLLREVLFGPDGRPYETTNYNYILKPGGMNRAVLFPSGEKVCTVSTIFDLPQSMTDFPAPGYAGEQGPRTVSWEYDQEGNLTKSVQKGAKKEEGSVEYVRDDRKRVKQIKSLVDPVNDRYVTVTNDYAADTDLIPSRIVSQDGSVTEQGDVDPWGVQARRVTLDKNGAAPVSLYADYYPTGRPKESGIWGQRGRFWDYDANFLPKTLKVRKGPNSPWWETTYEYNKANQPVMVETPELTRRLRFDSLGNPVSIIDLPKDKISKEKKTCFHYSPDGRLLAAMYPGGNVAEYGYDPAGRMVSRKTGYPENSPEWAGSCAGLNIFSYFVSKMNPGPQAEAKKGLEEVLSLTYRPGGFLQKMRSNGVDETLVTDGFGRVIDRIDPRGVHRRVGYGPFGDRILWSAVYDSKAPAYGTPNFPDASLQAASEFEYDGLGRPTATRRWHFADGKPVGADLKRTTQFRYDDAQGIATATADGVSVTTKYDGLGRVVYQILPDNSKTTAQWDANLNQVVWTRPGPHGNEIKTTQAFDGLGLLSKVMDDQGRVVLEETHDALGRVVESKPAAGGAAHYVYDSFGRLSKTRQEAKHNGDIVLTNLWDDNDQPIGFKDGNGNLTQSRYDGQGRLVASLDANNRETRYEYLPGTSRVQKTFLPDGNNPVPDDSSTQINNEYDAVGLLVKQSIKHGANVVNYGNQSTVREFTYTLPGQMATAKITDANNGAVTNGMVNTFAYDSLGNVVLEKNSLLPFEIRHVTDLQGLKSSTIVNNEVIEKSFDKLGRLGTVTLDGQPIASFKYIGPGAPVGLTYGNGAVGSFIYDNRGFQTDVTVKDNNQGPLLSVHMAYGLDGSPRWKQYSLGKGGPVQNALYQVDLAGRLVAEASGLAGKDATGNLPVNPDNNDVEGLIDASPESRKYLLDPASNWRQVEKKANGKTDPLTFTPDATNAYTVAEGMAPKYDPAGNLTAFPDQNPTERYSYNGLGQLLDATSGQKTSGFYYDALGRRVAEMNTRGDFTYYVWDGNELLASGNNRNDADSFTLNVMMSPNAPLAVADHQGKGNKVYLLSGPDGSILAASDAQSGLVEGYAYSAYGKPAFLDANGSEMKESKIGNRFLFQGLLYDNDSDLYLTDARAYNPALGRFLTRDPIGLLGGQNAYAYGGDNPLSFTDPRGLCGKTNSNPSERGGDGPSIRAETRSYAQRLDDIRQGCLRTAAAGSFADCVAEQATDAGVRKSKNFLPSKSEVQLRRLGEALQLASLPLAFGERSALEAVSLAAEAGEVVESTVALAPKAAAPVIEKVVSQRSIGQVIEYRAIVNGETAGELTVLDKGNGTIKIAMAYTPGAYEGQGIYRQLFAEAAQGQKVVATAVANPQTIRVLDQAVYEGRSLQQAFRETPLGKVRERAGFTVHGFTQDSSGRWDVVSRRPSP